MVKLFLKHIRFSGSFTLLSRSLFSDIFCTNPSRNLSSNYTFTIMSSSDSHINVLKANILKANANHEKKIEKYIAYGTAGFRTKAELLDHVMFRTGIVAALRSLNTGASIGVMVTASHNPEEDNGVKLVDPQGEMLDNAWEIMSTEIANASNTEFVALIEKLITKHAISLDRPCSVVIGRDTRKSSPDLTKSVIDGVNCVATGCIDDYGVVSTPMVHYFVVCKNTKGAYGEPTAIGYYSKLSNAFKQIIGDNPTNGRYVPSVILDGANGVGSIVVKEIQKLINSDTLNINLLNDGPPGILNFDCGADYVKVQQTTPPNIPPKTNIRCLSLDGDADRVIYFYFNENLEFRMLDGDKIALLFAEHLNDLVKNSGLDFSIGIIQTAYANGSSTKYITQKLNMPVTCVPTGVKHLHHAALTYDIGVYFEANGHGTVVFSQKVNDTVKNVNPSSKFVAELASFLQLINSCVGDAVSDFLVVEAILHSKGWNIQDWDAMYSDLPNRQLKVCVADRTVIETTDAERKCVTPEGLQSQIDALSLKYNDGRSFVRPSGTEDVVRVYAEADTQEHADLLAKEVATVVYELAGGVGQRPGA